jgi:hypothetical protein
MEGYKMKEKIAKLIELKSIVTMALIGCTCYLAIKSGFTIAPEFFASIVTAVITYYFTRKENK